MEECVALNLILSTVKNNFLFLAKYQWDAEAGETQMLGQSEQRGTVRFSYFEVGRWY